MFEIGNTLREARVRRNLTLQQVEEDTKIRVKYVQAMENEDFDVMPGATYVKGFLRTYSEYLALDPEVILDEYRSRGIRTGEIQEPFGGVSMLGAPRSHRGRNTLVFVAVICLLVLGVIWILGHAAPSTRSRPPSPAPSASDRPSPVAVGQHVRQAQEPPAPVVQGERAHHRRRRRAGSRSAETSPPARCCSRGTVNKGKTRVFVGDVLWLRLGNPSAVRSARRGAQDRAQRRRGPRRLHRQGRQAREAGPTWPRNLRSTSSRSADINEVRNAVNMAQKEIATRYDFKKSVSSITLEGEALVLVSDDDGKLKQVVEVLEEKLVRRKVPLKALQYGKVEEALGGTVRQRVPIAQGIPDDKIKAMNKLLRQRFKKVKSQIQGDTLRVFSASKDELQAAMAALREEDWGVPLQFVNYR